MRVRGIGSKEDNVEVGSQTCLDQDLGQGFADSVFGQSERDVFLDCTDGFKGCDVDLEIRWETGIGGLQL